MPAPTNSATAPTNGVRPPKRVRDEDEPAQEKEYAHARHDVRGHEKVCNNPEAGVDVVIDNVDTTSANMEMEHVQWRESTRWTGEQGHESGSDHGGQLRSDASDSGDGADDGSTFSESDAEVCGPCMPGDDISLLDTHVTSGLPHARLPTARRTRRTDAILSLTPAALQRMRAHLSGHMETRLEHARRARGDG